MCVLFLLTMGVVIVLVKWVETMNQWEASRAGVICLFCDCIKGGADEFLGFRRVPLCCAFLYFWMSLLLLREVDDCFRGNDE